MTKHRQIETDGLIVTHFSGTHTYQDAIKALDELLELNKGASEIYEIVINDYDLKIKFSPNERELIGHKVESTFSHFKKGALAVVAKHDLAFGLSRMLEMSVNNELITVAVFRSEDLARKWIQEIRGLHNQKSHRDTLHAQTQ